MVTQTLLCCLLLLVCQIGRVCHGQGYIPCDCKSTQPWATDYSTNDADLQDLVEWFRLINYDEDRCGKGATKKLFHEVIQKGGLGISFGMMMPFSLLQAMEMYKIFSPSQGWLWADVSQHRCTLNSSRADCYFEPISTCGFSQPLIEQEAKVNKKDVAYYQMKANVNYSSTRLGSMFVGPWYDNSKQNIAICDIAHKLKKPVIWVYGAAIQYLTRYSLPIKERVQKKVEHVLPGEDLDLHSLVIGEEITGITGGEGEGKINKNKKRKLTVCMHMRAGHGDRGRHIWPLSKYMEQLDLKASELKKRGEEIEMVYISTHIHDNTTFTSAEHLEQMYPRSWKYTMLPLIDLVQYAKAAGHKDPNHGNQGALEPETILRAGDVDKGGPGGQKQVDMSELVVEYLADIEIMVRVDVYIGSFSYIYIHAASLRAARYGDRRQGGQGEVKDTCWVDAWENSGQLHCNDNDLIYKWHGIAMEGGTPFFEK